ncbi:hypothetical protein EMIHUDRAFT_449064 [Emiliania huxleyi CCMP1516]|uniref:Uncharacterized protein n=2 Tax=Emiliania huxleyi TaxID=2903 RepID=A0A0D3KR73_EMIH1|nr:hypothetical protein EMIHUDRAFT_449064 [Emiliania huxleyi CCMP1516]EOD38258.1 hypothetical protein EMIHUDRAFT_449064 [Emiliania huxleyi CCMP1516]|eukprot:XP_005790687.1 hypothetical protein EMIHUDRAFT_449064 [Emiliania huxleyi CCMP1516]
MQERCAENEQWCTNEVLYRIQAEPMRNATSMALRALLLVALLADGAPDQSPGRGVRRQPTLLAVDGRALAEMGALRLSGSAAAANVGAVSETVRSWWTKGGVMDTAGGALLALKAYTLWFFFGLLALRLSLAPGAAGEGGVEEEGDAAAVDETSREDASLARALAAALCRAAAFCGGAALALLFGALQLSLPAVLIPAGRWIRLRRAAVASGAMPAGAVASGAMPSYDFLPKIKGIKSGIR